MKTLLLLRHAKSSWDDPSLADIERPLSPRGIEATNRMGWELAKRGWLPQRALVSSALRTRMTWELFAAEHGPPSETSFRDSLYHAEPKKLLQEIRITPRRIDDLLVIGHNPGLEDLARSLCGPASDKAAMKILQQKFPTCALARFEFDGRWEDLGFRAATLTHCLYPRQLA
jgi:phosphohistidine phosphatase